MMQLRDYQSAAIDGLYSWFGAAKGNPLVVAPTGAGKSVILAEFIRRAIADYGDTRIIMATHVKELIAQNYAALLRLWPNAPAGIYSAGLGRRQMRQVTFAGIQSVAKKAADFGHIDILIVDEAHLIPRSGDTLYQKFIEGLRLTNPNLKVIGLTATPFRLDSGRLDRGQGAIFDGIAYDIPIPMLVTRGYLAPLISKRPGFVFDTTGLHTRAGDFVEGEMNDRFNKDDVTRAAVSEIIALGQDRRSWLLFCISVDHASAVKAELIRQGIPADLVTGDTPAMERARILEDFKAGRIRALTNVNVLTTGFDAPATDLLAFLRPTKSLGLYMQMAGRAMRIAPGKESGLVLDYAGNVARHGPVDAVSATEGSAKSGKKLEGEIAAAPAKACPQCNSILWIGARECTDCGHVFPEPEPKIERTSSTDAIMNLTAVDDWQPVRDFALTRHSKDGKASLRADYLVGSRVVKEFVCLEHVGFARQKAVTWWHQNAGTTPPATVADALERQAEVRIPTEVVVRKEGDWWRVTRTRGDARQEVAA
jgi:DNA repair protein RadD